MNKENFKILIKNISNILSLIYEAITEYVINWFEKIDNLNYIGISKLLKLIGFNITSTEISKIAEISSKIELGIFVLSILCFIIKKVKK